jgi:hypothetical protein
MSYYKILIEKVEDNEHYKEELAKFNLENREHEYYGRSMINSLKEREEPVRQLTIGVLQTVLNEEQFEAIRRAALEKL